MKKIIVFLSVAFIAVAIGCFSVVKAQNSTIYTITANANGGLIITSSNDWVIDIDNNIATKSVNAGNAYGSLPLVSKVSDGKLFKEWNTASDGSGTTVTKGTVANDNATIYAIYEDQVQDVGTIHFIEESYTCNTGDTIDTAVITVDKVASYNQSYPKYTSSNESVMTAEKSSRSTVCTTFYLITRAGVSCSPVTITCSAAGTATLTAISASGATNTVDVNVTTGATIPVESIRLNTEFNRVDVGSTITINTTITPSNATNQNLTWKSSDNSIATVANGVVTGIKSGNVIITAETENGKSDTISIVVVDYVKFDAPYNGYVCHVGDTIHTKYTYSGTGYQAYRSTEPQVATIEASDTILNCSDCTAVDIKCLSAGVTNVNVDSTYLDSTGAAVKVVDPSVPIKTITFNANGGTLRVSKENVSTYTLQAADTDKLEDVAWFIEASKNNKVFRGWYTAASGGNLVYSRRVNVSSTNNALVSDVNVDTLYAHYADGINYKAFDLDGGSYVNEESVSCFTDRTHGIEMCNGSYYGDSYGDTLPEVTKEGYIFTGWYTAKEGGSLVQSTDTTPSVEQITLYARFVQEGSTYTLTYDPNGGTGCTDSTLVATAGTAWGTLCTPTYEGYKFNGWFTQKTGGDKITEDTIAEGDITVYAQWRKKTIDESPNTGISTPVLALILLGGISSIAFFIVMKKNMTL